MARIRREQPRAEGVFERVDGSAKAVETPIGYLPTPADLDTSGLSVNANDLDEILSVDVKGWREAVPQIREHYAAFGPKLPNQLLEALDALDKSLAPA